MTAAPERDVTPHGIEIVTGDWLDVQEFPPLRWVVPGVIAEGLTILAGAPKLGKSWFALHLALSVASGGKALGCIEVGRSRPVLYFALEDGYRRVQGRARTLLGEGELIPCKLHLVIKGERHELKAALIDWLDRHQNTQPLVIVDTLAKLRPPTSKADNAYDADYRYVGGLKDIIDAVPGGAMVLVHHTNKRADGDFLDAVSGTQGIAGAADATITLRRSRQEQTATLAVTGRDVIENEYAVTTTEGLWTLDGGDLDAASKAATENRNTENVGDRMAEVIAFVSGRTETKAGEVADHLRISADQARKYLGRAYDAGRIAKAGRGTYVGVTNVTSVTSDVLTTQNVTPETDVTHTEGDNVRPSNTWRVSGESITN